MYRSHLYWYPHLSNHVIITYRRHAYHQHRLAGRSMYEQAMYSTGNDSHRYTEPCIIGSDTSVHSAASQRVTARSSAVYTV